jgi:methylmalonyl-CoA mutase
VRASQIDKLKRLKADRDQKALGSALDALSKSAQSGEGNLLDLALKAARAKATVGEISAALEKVWGRHQAEIRSAGGAYAHEMEGTDTVPRVKRLAETFETLTGRRPRILVAKVGQDGHDRGQKVIASAFSDLGFEVVIGPLFATPEEAAEQAIKEDVHIVGVSSLAAGHLTLVPALKRELEKRGAADIMLVAGGTIPAGDHAALEAAGIEGIFGPGTNIADAAESLVRKLAKRMGRVLDNVS